MSLGDRNTTNSSLNDPAERKYAVRLRILFPQTNTKHQKPGMRDRIVRRSDDSYYHESRVDRQLNVRMKGGSKREGSTVPCKTPTA